MRTLGTIAFAVLVAIAASCASPTPTHVQEPAPAPRSPQALSGIEGFWIGDYGPHGPELLDVRRTAGGGFIAVKLTGDENVPAGQATFTVDQYGKGNGLGADVGFRNPRFFSGVLKVTGPDSMVFVWADLGPMELKRVDRAGAEAFLARTIEAKPTPEQISQRAFASTVLIRTEEGVGSGFVVAGGLVVTNLHVVAGAGAITVRYASGQELQVQDVRGFDAVNDLALLNPNLNHRALPLSDDERPQQPGAPIIIVGNPLGLQGTVSTGVVSGVRKHPTLDYELLQIDAAISPGSSGGPVLDKAGRVIGVARMYLRDGQNLNFAVPVRFVKRLLRTSEGPIAMSTFAAATAPKPQQQAQPASKAKTRRPLFPKAVSGFTLGSSIAQAATQCGQALTGKPEFAVCAEPPVRLAFTTGEAWLTFTGGELTQIMLTGASWTEVRSALVSKYGEPQLVFARRKGEWVDADKWGVGKPGRAVWFLDGGRVVAASLKGTDILVLYVSDRDQELQQQNY
ncbi:MAG: DUF3506 domain-containing protein [Sorangiineae bacterium PRO1]|nr:DUF3506 domain-containing protein [Sorangiineae bacterium PRO1]